MLRFTDEHEWLQGEGDIATVGITTHAAEQLGAASQLIHALRGQPR